MPVANRFLFNFSASYSGGGYKRLHEYAKWFDARGGAWFAIHPHCRHLLADFPNNQYFVIAHSHLQRLYDDWGYLGEIGKSIGRPELYFAYGIPLYRQFGRINWSHLSNVLLLGTRGVTLSMRDRLKFLYLGARTTWGFANADVISAESRRSLELLAAAGFGNLFLSVNGSDDEIGELRGRASGLKDNTSTVVGTYKYKALEESVLVFETLKRTNPGLTLQIIGDTRQVPRSLTGRGDVTCLGALNRTAVIERLRRTRFYLSTTQIENAYNSAAEGAFLADESYISDIGAHRELLIGESYRKVTLPGVRTALLHLRRAELSGANLRSWHEVITEMTTKAAQTQSRLERLSVQPPVATVQSRASPARSK
ncbi:MAG: glycosyltransferase [Proteobacteria bacterium]|nr:glycosyltransferase [Pseudomonadota bacterium]